MTSIQSILLTFINPNSLVQFKQILLFLSTLHLNLSTNLLKTIGCIIISAIYNEHVGNSELFNPCRFNAIMDEIIMYDKLWKELGCNKPIEMPMAPIIVTFNTIVLIKRLEIRQFEICFLLLYLLLVSCINIILPVQ